jgi:hypothetical protein
MLVADDAFTILGMAVGFALWLGLCYAVYRWGPFEEGRSFSELFRDAKARLRGRET